MAGNVAWVIATSALLVGLPLVLVLEDESRVVQQEKEMLAQQQGAQAVCVISICNVCFLLITVLFFLDDGCAIPTQWTGFCRSKPAKATGSCAPWFLRGMHNPDKHPYLPYVT